MAGSTTPKTNDFTGREKVRLEKERDAQAVRDREELTMVANAEKQAVATEILDVTQVPSAPTVVDPVEVVSNPEDETEVIRVVDDMDQVTIGMKTYDFVAGRKYRVPAVVAFYLRTGGFLYERT